MNIKSPLIFAEKNLDSVYQGVNDALLKAVGVSEEHMLGHTDYECSHNLSKIASKLVRLDHLTMSNQGKLIDLAIFEDTQGKWSMLLNEKTPIINKEGKVTGLNLLGFSIPEPLFYVILSLIQPCQKKSLFKPQADVYLLSGQHSAFKLTPRQHECLFFLVRNKSAKEISEILDLSHRTVEDYLEEIKLKLNCISKSQLIDKAISHGYLFYLPDTLLSRFSF
jgi:DNA-binding CsgD family transcriptional regulator